MCLQMDDNDHAKNTDNTDMSAANNDDKDNYDRPMP